ncbi:hypothetical protein [Clostridium fallax]|uniref:Uncharacterized protein n=1 Tax=Clostridium fallax TaxID=1533 RepID=A0A1M4UXY7_9CLOT|nr:hypothetical protein [Clostridium fallax]SHE61520.1 hypothetical protein SAMN05443638_10651 [Clostridium fallax]SQB06745.1 Uncharacterised protein [Clostridium fallax]
MKNCKYLDFDNGQVYDIRTGNEVSDLKETDIDTLLEIVEEENINE